MVVIVRESAYRCKRSWLLQSDTRPDHDSDDDPRNCSTIQVTVETSLSSASYVRCQRDTARICCRAPGGRRCRSISPVGRALSSKPAVAACGGRVMGRTDGQTPDCFMVGGVV